MSYFVRREGKLVMEACRRPQPGRAEEELPDDHPDVVALFDRIDNPPKPIDPLAEIKTRLDRLEGKTGTLGIGR